MEKLLLTRKEAAQALNISTDTLDRLRESQDIQAVNIGSRVYFSPDELKAFLSKRGGSISTSGIRLSLCFLSPRRIGASYFPLPPSSGTGSFWPFLLVGRRRKIGGKLSRGY